MARRKVVVFIVEGISDETALAAILNKLLSADQVHFEIVHCDITTEKGTSPINILRRIGDRIRDISTRNYFLHQDFLEVVHLVDMDGAYIPDEAIKEICKADAGIIYKDDCIEVDHVVRIIKRNEQKRANIDRLINNPSVWKDIPYSVYFFSSNLDHVIHHNANMPDILKVTRATTFAFRYLNNLEGFLSFFNDLDISVGANYHDSWACIRSDLNSLKRGSNLHIYLSPQAQHIPRDFSRYHGEKVIPE